MTGLHGPWRARLAAHGLLFTAACDVAHSGSCFLLFVQVAAYGHGGYASPSSTCQAPCETGTDRAQALPPSGGVGDTEQVTARPCLQEKDSQHLPECSLGLGVISHLRERWGLHPGRACVPHQGVWPRAGVVFSCCCMYARWSKAIGVSSRHRVGRRQTQAWSQLSILGAKDGNRVVQPGPEWSLGSLVPICVTLGQYFDFFQPWFICIPLAVPSSFS